MNSYFQKTIFIYIIMKFYTDTLLHFKVLTHNFITEVTSDVV